MDKILEVKRLKVAFRTNGGTLKAVRDISFDLERGKTLAIVGESGSGKSVTSKAIIGILAGNAIVEGGEILYDGKDLLRIPEDVMHKIRGDKISMIFQDPLSSLNPIVKIGKQITEAMLLKNKANRKEARAEFNHMLRILKETMVSASGKENAAGINALCTGFDKYCIQASSLEQHYNNAFSTASDLISNIEDFLYKAEKNSAPDVSSTLRDFSGKLKQVDDSFLLGEKAADIAKAQGTLSALSHEKKADAVLPGLKEVETLLNTLINQPRPDFYAQDLPGIREFPEDVLVNAVRFSYTTALENKKKVVSALQASRDFFLGDFTKSTADKKARELTELVNSSIDRLEIIKDSAAYTFGSSISHAIEQYFEHMRSNPREEARFARQTARRERLIARGKHVEWKVVPKNVYDLADLKGNILTVVDRLIERYTAYIAASDSIDFTARAQDVVRYLKDKASQSVYRVTKGMAKERAIQLMEEVGIHEPRKRYYQYPFEFSGGMRQRIVIAIALAANPEILICDEPTTALDVTIQSQILELINKLKKERNLSIIFITHDLGVVANMADEIAVMYAGKIVEYGTANDIFYDPRHPYTWALLSSMPDLDTKEKLESIPGTPPNMIYPPKGDAFADRNKYAMQIDFEEQPPMFSVSETHTAATWLLHPDAPKVEMPEIIRARIARMQNGEAK